MTELAYLADIPSAYVRSFRARVATLPPGAVVLDRTFFYPTGGGQPSDRGRIWGPDGRSFEVVEVTRSGASVVHRLRLSGPAGRSLPVGTEVTGELDWPRRHRHMRLHTAQHLVSARLFVRTRLRTRRAVLSETTATIDLEGPLLASERRALIEDVRAQLDRGHAVSIRWVPRGEWDHHPSSERSGLVPLPAQVDPVRVVAIEDLDVCPCGGTHVGSTEEIGSLRFLPVPETLTPNLRVSFMLEEPDRPTGPGAIVTCAFTPPSIS